MLISVDVLISLISGEKYREMNYILCENMYVKYETDKNVTNWLARYWNMRICNCNCNCISSHFSKIPLLPRKQYCMNLVESKVPLYEICDSHRCMLFKCKCKHSGASFYVGDSYYTVWGRLLVYVKEKAYTLQFSMGFQNKFLIC